jgi:gliding motility-associated-like protein
MMQRKDILLAVLYKAWNILLYFFCINSHYKRRFDKGKYLNNFKDKKQPALKIIFSALSIIFLSYNGLGQCVFKPLLKSKNGFCAGRDTLVVSSQGKPILVKWYIDNQPDTTVYADSVINAVVVAGGNGSGTAGNQFSNPNCIFLDKQGNLYVSDVACDLRIMKFPPNSTSATNGTTVADLHYCSNYIPSLTPSVHLFGVPYAVAVDDSGYIYVDENIGYFASVIQKFPPNTVGNSIGKAVAGVPADTIPMRSLIDSNAINKSTGMFITRNGNIYVTDDQYNRVQKFPANTSSGTYSDIIAGGRGNGAAANLLNYPSALAVDNAGYVYVCDQRNNRIQKFPPGGNSFTNGITVAGGNGAGNGANQFMDPVGICLDADGYLYVADYSNSRIQKFPPNSTSATNGITLFKGIGGFGANALPLSIFVDSSKNIYVLEWFGNTNSQVEKFSETTIIDSILLPKIPGVYKAVVTDNNGCTDTTNSIVINPIPVTGLTINSTNSIVCQDAPATFTAIPANGGTVPNYEWQVNGITAEEGVNPFITSTLKNGDVISCVMTSSLPCALPTLSSTNITVSVQAPPAVSFNSDTIVIQAGASVTLNPIMSGIISTYQWTPTIGLSNPSSLNPVAGPPFTTVYKLAVTGTSGCKASAIETVLVYYPLKLPAAFTPNGDGINDIFRVPPLAPQAIQSFNIFSRWGQLVFSAINNTGGWDGTFGGSPLPQGNYIWIIKYKNLLTGKQESANGSVMLIR